MIVYSAPKQTFLADTFDRDIEDVILRRYRAATGHADVSSQERQSWRESLAQMAMVLQDADIPDDLGVGVEYHIHGTKKRIDVTLTGYGPDATRRMLVVELKQWSAVEPTGQDAIVRTYLGGREREVVHPSYQAWSYATLLEGFNAAVYEQGIQLVPCAYLHNYARDGRIDDARYDDYILKAPLFLKGAEDRRRLRQFIRTHLPAGDAGVLLAEIDRAPTRPSKALADSLASLVKGNPEFVLIDEQKLAYEAALAAGTSASLEQRKVVLIHGGPGTGKSVVAVHLLSALTAKGLDCRYVTKNGAPRAVFQAKLTGVRHRGHKYAGFFVGSGGFVDAVDGQHDVLIVDEAHRLNEKSGLYGNLGDHQIRELIGAASCTIFFLDEDQRVTLRDVGSRDTILGFAAEAGAEVSEYVLASQFRCNGSNGYLAWLDHTLQIRPTANERLRADEFDFRVFDSPEAMHAAVAARNDRNKARVVAGYCWPWTSKKTPSAFDITIGTYQKRWNLTDDGGLWAIAPDSIEQVGCIHTCQGLDLDYVGVIVGPDLVVRSGKVVTDPAKRDRMDQSIKGWKTLVQQSPTAGPAQLDAIIKNTYRTLMTRGMKGCFVYCVDPETAAYFRAHLDPGPTSA
jgi:DUF2075 family protein